MNTTKLIDVLSIVIFIITIAFTKIQIIPLVFMCYIIAYISGIYDEAEKHNVDEYGRPKSWRFNFQQSWKTLH